MSIFGIAKKGFGMLGKSRKTSPTIKSVKPNVPKTKLEKANRNLDIAKHKYKGSTKKLENTVEKINAQTKRLNKK